MSSCASFCSFLPPSLSLSLRLSVYSLFSLLLSSCVSGRYAMGQGSRIDRLLALVSGAAAAELRSAAAKQLGEAAAALDSAAAVAGLLAALLQMVRDSR